jgi:hypothetical protein
MDRAVRIIPFVVALVVTLWAYLVFDHTLSDVASTPTTAESMEEGAADGTGRGADPGDQGAADAPAPESLAFRPTFGSRIYLVSDEVEGLADAIAREASDEAPVGGAVLPQASPSLPPALGPGLYTTAFDTEGCSYELRRDGPRGGGDLVIGQDRLADGRMLVFLNEIEPDLFLPSPDCGRWSPWVPPDEPLVEADPGDYWIGDLAMGRWSVPVGCLWEEVADFRGARLADVVDSGRGPGTFVIDEDTLGIRFRDCDDPLVLVESGVDPRPPGLRRRDG